MAITRTTLSSLFTDIAEAIRSKTGGSDTIAADTFPTAITSISTLSDDTSDATALSSDIVAGKTAYIKGSKVTGTVSETASNGTIEFDGGSISTDDTYFIVKGTLDRERLCRKGATISLDFLKTYVASSVNLTSDKIVKGNNILGVEGTAEITPSGDYSDATAVASDIVESKTAYIATGKTTGTIKDGRGANAVIDSTTSAYSSGNGLYCKIRADMSPRVIDNNSNIVVPNSFAQELYGITANKIVKGNTIAGITGTAKSQQDFDSEIAQAIGASY